MKCNRTDECNQTDCPHFSEHDEIFNAENESLCTQPECCRVQEKVECRSNPTIKVGSVRVAVIVRGPLSWKIRGFE
jgi:hypothetical protein